MISPHKKKKIALIGYRLSGGGSDKVMANLSLFLQGQGYEVDVIIVLDELGYAYGGKLFNLGLLNKKSAGFFNRLVRFTALCNYLQRNRFDFIIDFRFRIKFVQELILSRLVYNDNTIFTVHSYLLDHYMPNNSYLTRLMYNKCWANVALGNQMKSYIETRHGLTNVVAIGNSVNMEEIRSKQDEVIDLEFDFILAVGQYEDDIKQFDRLIEVYAQSVLPARQLHLVILGKGNTEKLLEVAKRNKAADFVHLLGFQSNPFKYMKKARFLVLCSSNEGFSNVILESLACGTPAISFDCDFGPRDLITNQKNGILVENQNWEKLCQAMNLLAQDMTLYQKLKDNTVESCAPFHLDKIGALWLKLLEEQK